MNLNESIQKVVTEIAEEYDFDLKEEGARLELELGGQLPLVIEVEHQTVIRVGQYYETNDGSHQPNPALRFFTGFEEWLLLELTLVQGYVRTASGYADLTWYNPDKQNALMPFIEEWVESIKEAKQARGAQFGGVEVLNAELHGFRAWPAPTVEQPGFETLKEWFEDDAGCEATDGCWIEPDGVCSHGHPSWLIRMGLI